MSSSPAKQGGNSFASFLCVASLGVLIGVAFQYQSQLSSLTGEVATTKPYSNFEEFFPFYMGEHKLPECQLCHVIGTVLGIAMLALNPSVLLAWANGVAVGYVVFPLFRHQWHGGAEAAIALSVMYFWQRLLCCRRYTLLSVLFVGYAFAWVGHYVFEKNTPATFIYPSYSVLGDLNMARLYLQRFADVGFDVNHMLQHGVQFQFPE